MPLSAINNTSSVHYYEALRFFSELHVSVCRFTRFDPYLVDIEISIIIVNG
jgi:hypothetical protein